MCELFSSMSMYSDLQHSATTRTSGSRSASATQRIISRHFVRVSWICSARSRSFSKASSLKAKPDSAHRQRNVSRENTDTACLRTMGKSLFRDFRTIRSIYGIAARHHKYIDRVDKLDEVRASKRIQGIQRRIHDLSRGIYSVNRTTTPITCQIVLHTLHDSLGRLLISIASDSSQDLI